MSAETIDLDPFANVKLVPAGAAIAEGHARARAIDHETQRDPVEALIVRIGEDALAAFEVPSLDLAASLRGRDDLAFQRLRHALRTARADVPGWERAVNARSRAALSPSASTTGGGRPPGPTLDVRERYTDAWCAAKFAAEWRDRVRFVPERGWFAWTGTHWRFDDQAGLRAATEFCEALARVADEDEALEPTRRAKLSDALCGRSKIQSVEALARAKATLAVSVEGFDRDPYLLNCISGIVDLRVGKLRPHDPDALCSREAPVPFDADARADAFEGFLARVQPDAEIRAFLQRWAGYCASGVTSEQCLVVHWGTGANGKSTFVEAVNHVLGRYAQLVPSDVLLARTGHDAHPTERAQLCGLRHALVSETSGGKGWNENAVKQLTGDTKMTARYMRADFFEFTITHKLSVCTNNRPEVREHSHAFWRRVHLVPWAVQIPDAEKDPKLLEKLHAEAAGILAWLVRGAVAWVQRGLDPPAAIRAATEGYRAESDRLGLFLEERTRPLDGARVAASALYKAWGEWCEARGESAGSQTAFGERMAGREGIVRVKVRGSKAYRGIVLRDPAELGGDEGPDGGPWESTEDGGTVGGMVALSTVPLETASEIAARTPQGDRGDSCGEVPPPMHAGPPADGRADTSTSARARARPDSEGTTFVYADSRNNYPPRPPRRRLAGNSPANARGTVADREPAPRSTPLPGDSHGSLGPDEPDIEFDNIADEGDEWRDP